MDLRPFYFSALDNNERLFAGATSLDGPTPCGDWNTKQLMNHMVAGMHMFGRALGGEKFAPGRDIPDLIGDDPVGAFHAAKKVVVDAYGDEGALGRTVAILGGEMTGAQALRVAIMEAIVHGWDLSKATGQPHGINPMVATATLSGLQQTITDEQRGQGKPFQAEVKVPADAPIEEQLVAFLGRQP